MAKVKVNLDSKTRLYSKANWFDIAATKWTRLWTTIHQSDERPSLRTIHQWPKIFRHLCFGITLFASRIWKRQQKSLFLNLLKKKDIGGSWPPKRGCSTPSPLKATKHPGLTDDTGCFPLLWSITLEVLSTTEFMVVLRTRSWFWQSSSQLAADHRPPPTYSHASATPPPAAFWRWAGSSRHNRWDQSCRFPDISAAWRNTSASVTTGDRVGDAPVG